MEVLYPGGGDCIRWRARKSPLAVRAATSLLIVESFSNAWQRRNAGVGRRILRLNRRDCIVGEANAREYAHGQMSRSATAM